MEEWRACTLHGVLRSNIPHNVLEGLVASHPMSLPPHKFVEVARELVAITTLHSLEFCLHPVPVALYCLGVDTGSRVYKMKRMIDHPMSSHTRESGDRVVCPPLIGVDGGPWCCVCLDYWQEGVCIS